MTIFNSKTESPRKIQQREECGSSKRKRHHCTAQILNHVDSFVSRAVAEMLHELQ